MHRHNRWYLIAALSAATALTALVVATASAQRLQTTPTTPPSAKDVTLMAQSITVVPGGQ